MADSWNPAKNENGFFLNGILWLVKVVRLVERLF